MTTERLVRTTQTSAHQHHSATVALARILLVDDVPGEQNAFRSVFGSRVTAVRDLSALDAALALGTTWDLAFVDFNLGRGGPTGISAMHRIRAQRPGTKLVAYSQYAENGRMLFAAAARHWYGAAALLDKSHNYPQTLLRYSEMLMMGLDPSPVLWRDKLRQSSLIDRLLPDLDALRKWQALHRSYGDIDLAARLLDLRPTQLRTFKDRATTAVNEFNEAFLGIPHPGITRNKKGILAAFVASHGNFLTAPDLAEQLLHRSHSAN